MSLSEVTGTVPLWHIDVDGGTQGRMIGESAAAIKVACCVGL